MLFKSDIRFDRNHQVLLAAASVLVACGGSAPADEADAASAAADRAVRAETAAALWTTVASERQRFRLEQAATVRYGAGQTWVQRQLPAGEASCDNSFFGTDPLVGVFKRCERLEDAAATPTPGAWTLLANEWAGFTLSQPTQVRYGAGDVWLLRDLPAGAAVCSNAFFGTDPLFGVVKRCEARLDATTVWTFAAYERSAFMLDAPRRVRYGAADAWVERDLPAGEVPCTNAFFGADPLPGVMKRCEVAGAAPPPSVPPPSAPPPALAAFPGAQGSAASTPGGRGGAVYKVTNLDDAGPGSLRDCVEVKSGPRTCVFSVGGTIRLNTGLWITKPWLTVAGQTAPGGGILLTNADGAVISNLVGIATNDVIWQYTRLRNQWRAACNDSNNSECGGLFAAFEGRNIIAAHNSLSWNQDEGFGVWRGSATRELRSVTLTMNLVAEGLATHSTGVIVGGQTSAMAEGLTDIDMHHNLVMNNSHRNPLMQNKSGRVVNNIFYNQNYYVNQFGGGGRFDVIGNVYRKGPMNVNAGAHEIQVFATDAAGVDDAGRNVGAVIGAPSLHIAGNRGWNQPDPAGNQWALAWRVLTQNGGEALGSPAPDAWQRAAPLAAAGRAIQAEPVAAIDGASGSIVPTVGASRRLGCDGRWVDNRDAVDQRLIRQYLGATGIARKIDRETDVGGLPAIAGGAACVDADSDGLPDEWERLRFGGLQQGASGDADGDGYTNLEAYLYGI